ncbi:MAG: hypothetical protein K6G58_10810 [Lachnospiraceae bacterium]|nr:hypothetical protein [Lachnospiraceae bacterium]
MDTNEDRREEKIGRAIVTVSWLVFALVFIAIATVIAGVVMYFLGKPLWIAPLIAVGIFIVYRLILRLIWLFIEWAGRQ